jgi:hypothetical protein
MYVNGNLSLTQTSLTSGYDKRGEWQATTFHYTAGNSNITASIKTYPYDSDEFIVFSQVKNYQYLSFNIYFGNSY